MVFDLAYFSNLFTSFFQQPLTVILSELLGFGGWLIFVYYLFMAGFFLLAMYKATVYTKKWKWVLLAIDVPQLNVQTPKAVEQMFAHIFSVYESPAIATVYHRGFAQFTFSFEIVSIEGYIQFMVRTLDTYRNVVEAAIYAQYPEAEITEIEDYTTDIPSAYPNPTHNVWAADFALSQPYAYPIRLYKEFEHSISKDTILKDPMGTFLESFSRIGPGEQMWYQMIIEPTPEKKWKPECLKEIKKLIGDKSGGGGGGNKFIDALTDFPKKAILTAADQIFGREPGESGGAEKKGDPNNLLYMTPGQKKLVEAMEDKISKIGFNTKIRAVYVARHDVFNPSRGVNSLVGAINQFNVPSSNALLPKYLTSVRYFFSSQRKDYRRTLLMNAYKNRDMSAGLPPYVLNLEELATVWHFPMSHAKVPLLQKTGSKRTEPPAGLPVEYWSDEQPSPQETSPNQEAGTAESASSKKVRYRTDSGEVVYEDDVRFG